MYIEVKGFGNKGKFVDKDTGTSYGNYCPVCETIIRAPSNAWPHSLWKHTQSQKHQRNNNPCSCKSK